MNCCFVMHEIFCLVITNLNLHTVEYLITRSINTRCFNVPVVVVWTKKIDKLLWIHALHEINDMFRYWNFFCFSFLRNGKCNWRSSLNMFVSTCVGFVLLILFFHDP